MQKQEKETTLLLASKGAGMRIEDILKRTDSETYKKLKSKFNYKECMKRKCKDCKKKKECFKEQE